MNDNYTEEDYQRFQSELKSYNRKITMKNTFRILICGFVLFCIVLSIRACWQESTNPKYPGQRVRTINRHDYIVTGYGTKETITHAADCKNVCDEKGNCN